MKQPKVLYFILGVATAAQMALAARAGAKIRDALAYFPGDFIEPCEFVMGAAPKPYNKFKRHELDPEAQKLQDDAAAAAGGKKGDGLSPERRQAIQAALDQLDPDNDEHWTKSGLPEMKAVEAIVGDKSVSRDDVKAVAPDFKRPE